MQLKHLCQAHKEYFNSAIYVKSIKCHRSCNCFDDSPHCFLLLCMFVYVFFLVLFSLFYSLLSFFLDASWIAAQ